MSNAHEPIFKHSPEGVTYAVSCAASDCHYLLSAGGSDDERYRSLFESHRSQYDPGRAPDIEIEYELVATCSVCADGGDVKDEGETVACAKCGTNWYRDGSYGERAEVAA